MRGKGWHCQLKILCHGITPAYAGKRTEITEVEDENGDHPRLCGEKLTPLKIYRINWGSPPPMRGKVARYFSARSVGRITPAYAGKRFSFSVFVARIRDHPRLCGEKQQKRTLNVVGTGSPPPMRGKDGAAVKKEIKKRITPAYAGKRRFH